MRITSQVKVYIISFTIAAFLLVIGDIIIFNKIASFSEVTKVSEIVEAKEQAGLFQMIGIGFNLLMVALLVLFGFLLIKSLISQLTLSNNELTESKESYDKLKSKASKIYATNKGVRKLLAKSQNELDEQKSMIENLAEENEAKEPLKRAAAIRQKLVDISLDGIVMIHGEQFVEVNKAFLGFFGLEEESDLIGKDSFDISPEIQPDGMTSVEKLNGIFEKVIENGTQEFEWQLQKPDGSTFDALINGSFIEMKDEKPLTQFTIKDISERTKQENILKEATEKANAMSKKMRDIALEQTKAAEIRQKLFDISLDGIVMIHGEEFIDTNRSFLEFFGFKKAIQLIGKTSFDISPKYQPDGMTSVDKLNGIFEKVIANGSHEFEWVLQRPDGSTFDALINGSFIEHREGKPLTQFTIKDVTGEKASKEALENVAAIRKKLVNISLDGIVMIHGEQFVEANRSFLNFFGFRQESELLGKTSFDISPEIQPDGTASVEKLNGIFGQVIEKGTQEFEWQLQRPDGSTFNALINGSFIEMKDNEPLTQFTIRDVTKEKANKDALEKAASIRKKLVDISLDGIVMIHGEEFVEANKSFLGFFGFKKESELLGKNSFDISPELQPDGTTSVEKLNGIFEQVIEKGTQEFEWQLQRPDGTTFDCLINGSFIEMKDDQPLTQFTIKNISERKKQEEKLKEASEKANAMSQRMRKIALEQTKAAEIRQKLVDISLDGIVMIHGEQFVEANKSFLGFFGFKKESELLGKTSFDISPEHQPDGMTSVEKLNGIFGQVIEKGTQEFEWQLQRPDGSTFDCLINGSFIEMKDDQPLTQFTIKDVTEDKATKDILEKAAAIRKKLVDISLDGIVMIHGEQFVEANKSFLEFFGFKKESELLGKTSFDISPELQPDGMTSVEKLNGIFGQVIEKGTQEFDWQLQRPDGTTFDTLINGSFIEMKDDQPLTQFTIKDISERKKQEEKLREASEKANAMSQRMRKIALEQTKAAEMRQKLFEISNDGILMLHGEEFTEANQAYLDFFGFDSIEGKVITDVSAPIQQDGTPVMEKAIQRIEEAIKNRNNEFEWLHQRPDGTQFLGLVNMVFIEEVDEKPLLQLTIKDITVEKEAQEELKRAVAIRHKLESISLDGIVMIHGEQFVEANKSFLGFFGFKKESELLGKTSFDISPEHQPDGMTSVEKLNGIFGQVIEKGTQEFEWQLQRPDGSTFDCLINGSFIEMKDDQPLTQFTIKDVTEKKKQEAELKKANEKSLAMSKKMQKVALEQTKAAEKLILAEQELKKTLAKEKEGTNKLMHAMDSLKDAQSQLVNSEKMASLGQLTAGIAHEINNPINFVYNGVETLKESMDEMMTIINKYNDLESANGNFDQVLDEIKELKEKLDYEYLTEDINQMIDDIKVGAVRTIEIVKGLRVFSRLDEEERKKANVNENLDATLILLRNKTKDKVLVKRFFDEDMSSIFCYPGQLNQVFMNLLNNAVQAFPEDHEKPMIEIFTEDSESVIKVRIKDNGVGIPDNVKKRIFEPFFTTKDVGVGTGLGLSISYGIIEKHDGTINVNSEVGKGTEFVINLPKLSK